MYYQTQILPVDDQGHFILAVHFARHKIGGECTREDQHAYFAYGHVDHIEQLTEFTDLCCLERPSCQNEAASYRQIAETQNDPSRAAEYTYLANKAETISRYVPRTVIASNKGTLAIGLECETNNQSTSAIFRVIDPLSQTILIEQQGDDWPQAKSLAYPIAFARDGQTFVSQSVAPANDMGNSAFDLPTCDQKIRYRQVLPRAKFMAVEGGWLVIDDDHISYFQTSSAEPVKQYPLPKGTVSWTADVAEDAGLIACSGNAGLVVVLDLETGKSKKYYPHIGCKRDDIADIKLSPLGDWMVSKLGGKTDLLVSRLADGKSWKIGDLQDQHLPEVELEGYSTESQIPATFAFVGSSLLVAEGPTLQRLDYAAQEANAEVFVSEQGKPGARTPIKLSAKSTFEQTLKAAKLNNQRDILTAHYSPAVKLLSKKTKKSGWSMPDKRGAPELGVSRLGGWPDLPIKQPWPQWQGRPMSFIAQVNLAELHSVQPEIALPADGLLLFFIGCNEQTYHSDRINRQTYHVDLMQALQPDQDNAVQVILAEIDDNAADCLQRTQYRGDIAPELFAPSLLRLVRGGMPWPHEMTAVYDTLAFEAEEMVRYNEVLQLLFEETPENQMMGYANLIQSTAPELSCELLVQGNNAFEFPSAGSQAMTSLTQQASQWRLLLQLTSDVNADFIWGDAGHLYFYGQAKAMAAGDFSNIRLAFEC